ncbi:MAG: tRNA (adenosine(37)-N6)-dimethylallyltransferase MiaA [Chloroflexi bacterium]|nr:tRNA (adenosine(37)-N6)-dimethylallyltransferase MiaA [Chloroflexota bacterium]
MNPVLVVVGPTGVGKSRLALEMAQKLGGEIINADSRQVYRYMDIGTGKPGPQDRALVSHHLLDIVDPDQEFSLALFQPRAYQAIEVVLQRAKLPILVGGTGQYIWGVVEGWQVPRVPPDSAFRQEMEERVRREGIGPLFDELRAMDPEVASRIDPRNVRRAIRALELARAGVRGREKRPPPYRFLIIGLTAPRGELYARIDKRVDDMIGRGWVEEVRALLDKGYSPSLPALSSVGYREIMGYLRGEAGLPQAVQRIKYATHSFARRQSAWFRLDDPRISWLEARGGEVERAFALVKEAFEVR